MLGSSYDKYTMLFGLIVLITALGIAAIAAWFSIVGLMAIFGGAATSVAIMAGSLEVGKLVTASWLYRNWKQTSFMLKSYLTIATFMLMVITSMGIFGYLSQAHLQTSAIGGEVQAKVEIIDEKIATERANIETARKALQQMDAQVDQMLARTDDDRGANRAVRIRRQQAPERAELQADISRAQETISKLNEEKAPIASALRKVESEVGPIKYVASLIYGDNPDANLLERAVRWMIILLVVVFDPLAVALLIAANQTLSRHGIHLEKPDPEPEPKPEPKDDFAEKFLASKGTVDPDINLDIDDEKNQLNLDLVPAEKKRTLTQRFDTLKSQAQNGWSKLSKKWLRKSQAQSE